MSPTPGVEWRSRAMASSTLWPGQLTALAGLGALGDLDLQLVRVHQVVSGDPEARRCDLLDRASPPVAVGVRLVTRGVLAALAGVRLRADAVHRDGEQLVHLLAERAVRHAARREAADDVERRLDLVKGHRRRATRAA